MSEDRPDGLIPYPMPDAFTEDADGNIVPVRNILPRHAARGRFYENGPLSSCDRAGIHQQPCTCAALPLRPLAEVLREQIAMPLATFDLSCYWPIEDACRETGREP